MGKQSIHATQPARHSHLRRGAIGFATTRSGSTPPKAPACTGDARRPIPLPADGWCHGRLGFQCSCGHAKPSHQAQQLIRKGGFAC